MMPSTPEFLAIGHVARDLHSDGTFSPGGTVTFATLTASRLGLTAAIVTRADPAMSAFLPTFLPAISLHILPSSQTTTFANQYEDGFRTQYLYARAEKIQIIDVPDSWRLAPIVLFGPLAQEILPEFVMLFPRLPGAIIAATPQGWLRRWDADGRVWPTPWQTAEQMLPLLDVLILSHDDLLPFADGNRNEADAILAAWSMRVPLLIATDGRHGATLFRQGHTQRFPAYPAKEVDPTGAGDVFAAAFLISLYKDGDPERAVDFANCVASFSIGRPDVQGIPTIDMLKQRFPKSST